MLENVTITREQDNIVCKAVKKVTRDTSNPKLAKLGGILTHRWGFQTDIEEEDNIDEDNIEEDNIEEDNIEEDKIIKEVLMYVDEVFESSKNFLATPTKDNTDVSVQLTPPSSDYKSSPDRSASWWGAGWAPPGTSSPSPPPTYLPSQKKFLLSYL